MLEDQNQIGTGPFSFLDTGPYGTFVVVYDGNDGTETCHFVCGHLFQHSKRFAFEQKFISIEVIRKA